VPFPFLRQTIGLLDRRTTDYPATDACRVGLSNENTFVFVRLSSMRQRSKYSDTL
jgi:hypothetical protein